MLAQLSEALHKRGLPRPILVGGAATEFYSGSAIMTGDVDLTSPVLAELEEELLRLGFSKPVGLGHTPLGWVHPDLQLGFEIVATTPLDGAVDRARIRLIDLDSGAFAIIPAEDMIADRMGQFASGSAPEMLLQARSLWQLQTELDLDYLERRIRYETAGDHGIEDLKS